MLVVLEEGVVRVMAMRYSAYTTTEGGSHMSTALIPSRGVVKHFSQTELEARERAVVSALERRFGSVDAALAQEYTGEYPSDDLKLFSEYHSLMFLLGK